METRLEHGSRAKKWKNRGSLHSYFDQGVHDKVYGNKESRRPHTAIKSSQEIKRSALVFTGGGRIEIDQKVLMEDCVNDFSQAWFYKGATTAITHRWDTSVLKAFEPKMTSVQPIDDTNSEVHMDLLDQMNHKIQAEGINTKLHNSKYNALIDVGAPRSHSPGSKAEVAARKPHEQEVQELFDSAITNNSIDTFVKRKYVSLRANQSLGVNSPDIILFKECLKRNVLPPGSLDLQKSTDGSDLNHSYDPAASTRNLAMMTSTLMGRSSVATSSVELDMNNSIISVAEHQQPHHNSSTISIGSMDSTDLIGIENEQVVSLNLSNRGIGNDRGICLSSALSYCPHLTIIRICNNRLGDRSLSMILKAIFNISYCEELDISSNSVGDSSTACLTEYLRVAHCSLKKLNVRRCGIDDDNCILLCKSLHRNESLHSLDISENLSLHDDFLLSHGDAPNGGVAMAELIAQNNTLLELKTARNHIRKQCARLLVDKLALNTSLRLLDLSHNDIADQEARLFSRSLHVHPALTHVDLSSNCIGSKGAIALAYAAQQPDSAMQYLNLNGNNIGRMGGVYMLRAMRAVASYTDIGHHKHARHFAISGSEHPEDNIEDAPPRRLLSIDYKVTVLPHRDENIYDVNHPLKHYELNLSDPYDYTIARMLVDLADRHPTASFKSLKYLQPDSHLWEYIHLGRGGLFELPAEFGLTPMQLWSENSAEITQAIETIQAAKIAEMQALSSGAKDNQGRRKAFRASTAEDSNGITANERLGSAISIAQSPGGHSADAKSSDAAKHMRHRTRSARHVLYKIGAKLGFLFDEVILLRIIDQLCSASVEARGKFATLIEIIYTEVYHSLKDRVEKPARMTKKLHFAEITALKTLPLKLLSEQMSLFGMYKDNDLEDMISAAERVQRLISECDLAEEKKFLTLRSYIQIIMSRQIEVTPPTSRTFWTALNTTHPWVVPSTGLLHVELTYPHLPPTIHHQISNNSLRALLAQVTNNRNSSERSLDQIEQILQGVNNELFLSCVQAEVILKRFSSFKTHSHFSLVEKLVYQLLSPMEVRRFLVRNLFFNEILTLRRKLNYMFKILTGNVTGHYILDMRNERHRQAGLRLAELNTFHQMQVLKRDLNTSQCGTGDCFRNASFNAEYLLLDSAWFTELPEIGKLRFDYTSPVRTPEGLSPSAGSWGCSFEGYTPQSTAGTGIGTGAAVSTDVIAGKKNAVMDKIDEMSPTGSLCEGEEEDDDALYDETAQHEGRFSSVHAKEQFALELVENLFAKKFDPRSKALRREFKSCPKNANPTMRHGAGKGTGKFFEEMSEFTTKHHSENVPNSGTGHVNKIKQLKFDASVIGGRTIPTTMKNAINKRIEDAQQNEQTLHFKKGVEDEEARSTASESSDEEFNMNKGADGADPGIHVREDSFSNWNMRSKMFQVQKPSETTAACALSNSNGNNISPPKKKDKLISKIREIYLSEVTDYWKDTADTCWARYRANHIDQLKKKLNDILIEFPLDKDVNAIIPPSTYLHKDFVALRNCPVFKSVGLGGTKRSRRPNSSTTAGLPLNYSLNQTAMWGGISGSKKYSVSLERATVEDMAAAAAATASTSSGKVFTASDKSAKSSKNRRRSTRMSITNKAGTENSVAEALIAAAGGAGSLSIEDSGGNAAVVSKLAFEKFLLRLEAVNIYNMWLTVDQVRIIMNALLAHSAPVSVIVRTLCILFNCIVDRSQFYSLFQSCSDQLRNEVVHRIGILNVWNPACTDGKFDLDLAALDHREACRIMCFLVHETASETGRHEMTEVIYYKDSLLDAPTYLTTRSHTRSSSSGPRSPNSPSSPTAMNHTASAASFSEDHLSAAWNPPELWSKPDPAGPPKHGHIQFIFRTYIAPSYLLV